MANQNIKEELQSRGYKMTKQRRAILDVVSSDTHTALTARGIHQRAKDICPGTNFSTIYRNLELLADLGILSVIPMEGGRAYVLVKDYNHGHHLICKGCGATQLIDRCPLDQMQLETWAGFLPTEHRFEVFGYCRRCQRRKTNNEQHSAQTI
ncbi:transcriptional repressor [Metallumcola ferriviriculae]|uniref:Transcriptional repressor n=1 Tax=Metallumcola ferriviriculae TaxID=3039180 RepID=A0AAU0UQU3_9FIRM|nr:transcriptional repressor [Desulfitibacteraceae bacterium MK1]